MQETSPDATAIFAPIWRRKWLILGVAVLVAAASYLYFRRERPTFQMSTQVFLGASAEEQLPTGRTAHLSKVPLAGQATIVDTIVLEEARRKLRTEHKGALLTKAKVHATVPEKSEFLTILVEAHSRKTTATVANLIAQTYIARQETKRERGIRKAIAISRAQLAKIEANAAAKETKPTGKQKGSSTKSAPSASNVIQAANLSTKINELESSLSTITAVQIKPAKPANALLLSPKPRQDAIFGFIIALVLASLAAIAFSRFDKRMRTLASVEAVMGLPMLSVLPQVSRPVVRDGGVSRPSKLLLEPLRRLHTELRTSESVNGGDPLAAPRRRVLLVVSPDPGDGKSTLVADLALVQRDAGMRVVVLEANFRRPIQARLLGLEDATPLAEVLAGRVYPEDAMQRVLPAAPPEVLPSEGGGVATETQTFVGSLFALTADRSVANPPALLAQPSTAEVLRTLAARFDYVLIDVPSPLEVSDAVPLMSLVDGIVVVIRAGHTREASARRLRQMLGHPSQAPALGVVTNFVGRSELRRYGFSAPSPRRWLGGGRRAR